MWPFKRKQNEFVLAERSAYEIRLLAVQFPIRTSFIYLGHKYEVESHSFWDGDAGCWWAIPMLKGRRSVIDGVVQRVSLSFKQAQELHKQRAPE